MCLLKARIIAKCLHSFCGSGIQEQLIWGFWLRVSPEVAAGVDQGHRDLKTLLGWSDL